MTNFPTVIYWSWLLGAVFPDLLSFQADLFLRSVRTSDTRAFLSTSFRISFNVAKEVDPYIQPFSRKISQLPKDVHTEVIKDQVLMAFVTPSYVTLSLYLCVHYFYV